MTKPPLDPIVVENGQGDGGLPDPASTNKSDWGKALGEIDQLVASEEGPWGQRWGFPGYTRFKCKTTDPSVT